MKTMKEFLKEQGLEVPQGAAYAQWYRDNEMPLFVKCSRCGAPKVALLKAYVDDSGDTYCPDCAKELQQPKKADRPKARKRDDIDDAIAYIFGE